MVGSSVYQGSAQFPRSCQVLSAIYQKLRHHSRTFGENYHARTLPMVESRSSSLRTLKACSIESTDISSAKLPTPLHHGNRHFWGRYGRSLVTIRTPNCLLQQAFHSQVLRRIHLRAGVVHDNRDGEEMAPIFAWPPFHHFH